MGTVKIFGAYYYPQELSQQTQHISHTIYCRKPQELSKTEIRRFVECFRIKISIQFVKKKNRLKQTTL